jgi:transposase
MQLTHDFSGKNICEVLKIKSRSVQNFLKRYRKRGNIEIASRRGREKRCTRRDTRTLLRIVRSNSRSTLKDMTAAFRDLMFSSSPKFFPEKSWVERSM